MQRFKVILIVFIVLLPFLFMVLYFEIGTYVIISHFQAASVKVRPKSEQKRKCSILIVSFDMTDL